MNMLTVEQVAEKWGLSHRTIQNLCRNGKIDPAPLKKVKELHKDLHEGWIKIHNDVMERAVSKNVTIREREVAKRKENALFI